MRSHHQLYGHEFEWTPGVGDGQGGLACCDSWGRKESDMTERLNWTELCVCLIEWIFCRPPGLNSSMMFTDMNNDCNRQPWPGIVRVLYFTLACAKNTFSSEYLNDPLQKNLPIKYSKCSSLLREYVRICIHQFWIIHENSTFASKSRTMSCLNDWFALIKLIRKITNRHKSKENGVVTPHVPNI